VEVIGVRFWNLARHPRVVGEGDWKLQLDQVSSCTSTFSSDFCIRWFVFRIWIHARVGDVGWEHRLGDVVVGDVG
jgi:hypothetical protein